MFYVLNAYQIIFIISDILYEYYSALGNFVNFVISVGYSDNIYFVLFSYFNENNYVC